MKLVAVTACPTGIAHSQMAAENLEQTANAEGHEITVEIQGAMGAENELDAETIRAADAVIIAADTAVNRDRFSAVPVVKGTVKEGINDPESLFERAREAAGTVETDPASDAAEPRTAATTEEPESEATVGSDNHETAGGERTRDLETESTDVDPDQVGGDPRKGLFARLRRFIS